MCIRDRRKDELPVLTKKGYLALDVMEAHLADHLWFVGPGPTIADIALYAYTHVAGKGALIYPNIPMSSLGSTAFQIIPNIFGLPISQLSRPNIFPT